MMFWVTVAYAIFLLSAFAAGLLCGQLGILCDSRLDKARRKEAGLITELKALSAQREAYGYFQVLNKLGRKPGDIARELTEVRADIIRLGEAPLTLDPELRDLVVDLHNPKTQ